MPVCHTSHHIFNIMAYFIFAVVAPVKGGKKTKVSCFDKLCGASVHWDALCGPNHFPPAAQRIEQCDLSHVIQSTYL